MDNDVIRMVAAAYVHAGIGVNAKLAGVPRDVGDPLPANVTVADATRDAWVARRRVARGTHAALPALAVSLFRPAELEGEIGSSYRDGVFQVLTEYVARNAQTDDALRDGGTVIRATLRTLGEFHKEANAAMRTRNGVLLLSCLKLQSAPQWSEWEDAASTHAIIATYKVRDSQPLS